MVKMKAACNECLFLLSSYSFFRATNWQANHGRKQPCLQSPWNRSLWLHSQKPSGLALCLRLSFAFRLSLSLPFVRLAALVFTLVTLGIGTSAFAAFFPQALDFLLEAGHLGLRSFHVCLAVLRRPSQRAQIPGSSTGPGKPIRCVVLVVLQSLGGIFQLNGMVL